MNNKVKILGILPARGGSKGIPGKNLKKIQQIPLIGWAAKALAKAKLIDQSICSTDDRLISEAAKKFGLEVPFERPKAIAQDDSLVLDVMSHALEYYNGLGKHFTHVVLVQATSPTVTGSDIDSAITLALEKNADTVITAFPAGMYHPSMMFMRSVRGDVAWINVNQSESRRQDCSEIYVRTGLVYVFKVSTMLRTSSLYGGSTYPLIVSQDKAVNIDEESDFVLAEYLLKDQNHE